MANNVYNHLSVVQTTEEGQKVWDAIMERISNLPHERHLTGLFYEADENGRWIVPEGEYAGDKVGAKWAFATDFDIDSTTIESAWSPVIPLASWIAKEMGKVDPDVELRMTYEDEMPNFVGVATFNAEGLNDDKDLDAEDIQMMCLEESEELRELWDEDEQDWKEGKEDEAQDLFDEIQWDVIYEWMSKI